MLFIFHCFWIVDIYDSFCLTPKVKYKNAGEKIIIICKEHGDFLQTPNSHLSKESGCIKCAGCFKSNTEEFIKKSKEIHDDKYDYSKVEYKNVIEKVIIIC